MNLYLISKEVHHLYVIAIIVIIFSIIESSKSTNPLHTILNGNHNWISNYNDDLIAEVNEMFHVKDDAAAISDKVGNDDDDNYDNDDKVPSQKPRSFWPSETNESITNTTAAFSNYSQWPLWLTHIQRVPPPPPPPPPPAPLAFKQEKQQQNLVALGKPIISQKNFSFATLNNYQFCNFVIVNQFATTSNWPLLTSIIRKFNNKNLKLNKLKANDDEDNDTVRDKIYAGSEPGEIADTLQQKKKKKKSKLFHFPHDIEATTLASVGEDEIPAIKKKKPQTTNQKQQQQNRNFKFYTPNALQKPLSFGQLPQFVQQIENNKSHQQQQPQQQKRQQQQQQQQQLSLPTPLVKVHLDSENQKQQQQKQKLQKQQQQQNHQQQQQQYQEELKQQQQYQQYQQQYQQQYPPISSPDYRFLFNAQLYTKFYLYTLAKPQGQMLPQFYSKLFKIPSEENVTTTIPINDSTITTPPTTITTSTRIAAPQSARVLRIVADTISAALGVTAHGIAGMPDIHSEELKLYDSVSLRQSQFNPFNPTRILIHGWLGGSSAAIYNTLIPEFLKLQNGTYNVICMDWGRAAIADYITASYRVKTVAKVLAQFIDFLHRESGVDLENIHVIGFSMGAHVAGIAGKHLQTGHLPVIYGLDPALPLFRYENVHERLDKSDADYVEILHTSVGSYGYDRPLGHVDVYVNYGSAQPGCYLNECNHFRAYQLFAQSLRNRMALQAIECKKDLWQDMIKSRECKEMQGNETLVLNVEGLSKIERQKRRGVYYLLS